jgi:SAM-dependent methyltransferase
MALAQHKSKLIRFQQQVDNSLEYLLPFVERRIKISSGTKVLEIGCGEGGVLKPFTDKGCEVLGVDLSSSRIETACNMFKEEINAGQADFKVKNVWDQDFLDQYQGHFDLIILKDVIEHIPNQEAFIPYLKEFLSPKGYIFFGFPPWCMPFGGHQQVCKSKFLAFLPWYHLLPTGIYRGILKLFGERPKTIEELIEVKETGISLHRFERIISKSELTIGEKIHFFINPIYKFKFGIKPRKQAWIITKIPFFRDFATTAGWYLVSP